MFSAKWVEGSCHVADIPLVAADCIVHQVLIQVGVLIKTYAS